MLVSIIVNNFNYGPFLNAAIDSALNQIYPHIEVIVVDDGSTDESRKIIGRYGNRIIALLKENGGQGSAFNAGFDIARGEIVIFLDSDDILAADITQRVVNIFQTDSGISKVQYRLEVIDSEGVPQGRTEPPGYMKMPSGDRRKDIILYQNFTSPPTSGNAYSVGSLRQILPMPEDLFRGFADAYVDPLVGMLGTVISLDEIGGQYRLHGENISRPKTLDLSHMRVNLMRRALARQKQREIFNDRYKKNIPVLPMGDVNCIRARLTSLKLDPKNHPFPDSSLMLCLRGWIASFIYPRIRWDERILSMIWFLAMLIAPPKIARLLAEKAYLQNKRGILSTKLFRIIRNRSQA